ncbi:MAG: Rrf2 family transcriptional regulator [Clostridia bacterium]|nr:Rrf2 family transcriptional regulator [Clostridia bacterium]
MIGLTREADGALRITWLLGKTDTLTDAGSIAERTALSPKFALKILRKLSLGGVVTAQRGKNGGYRLAKEPKDISVRELIELLDGPIAINRCCDASYCCPRMGQNKRDCSFHCLFAAASERLAHDLDRVTLDMMLRDIDGTDKDTICFS